MAYERPRPFGSREPPPPIQWRVLLCLTLAVYVALSLFGLSAVTYWEAREQRAVVKTVRRTERVEAPAKKEPRFVRTVLDKGAAYPK